MDSRENVIYYLAVCLRADGVLTYWSRASLPASCIYMQSGEGMGRRDSRLVNVGGSLCAAASRGRTAARQELASTAARSGQDLKS